ncbi:MAG: hypothetical protein ACP5NO_08440 [Thermoplasmata archaeon]
MDEVSKTATKHRKNIIIDENVYEKLIKKRGEYEARTGKRISLGGFILLLLDGEAGGRKNGR